MQWKQFYNTATKVSSRKNATTFGDLPDCWVNTPDVGDLRRHHAHYDVTVMVEYFFNETACRRYIDVFAKQVYSVAPTDFLSRAHLLFTYTIRGVARRRQRGPGLNFKMGKIMKIS